MVVFIAFNNLPMDLIIVLEAHPALFDQHISKCSVKNNLQENSMKQSLFALWRYIAAQNCLQILLQSYYSQSWNKIVHLYLIVLCGKMSQTPEHIKTTILTWTILFTLHQEFLNVFSFCRDKYNHHEHHPPSLFLSHQLICSC